MDYDLSKYRIGKPIKAKGKMKKACLYKEKNILIIRVTYDNNHFESFDTKTGKKIDDGIEPIESKHEIKDYQERFDFLFNHLNTFQLRIHKNLSIPYFKAFLNVEVVERVEQKRKISEDIELTRKNLERKQEDIKKLQKEAAHFHQKMIQLKEQLKEI